MEGVGKLVVNKMGILSHSSYFQNLNENSILLQSSYLQNFNENNKIPPYAKDYKNEYLFIRGLNKEFKYLINKLDNLNNGLFESKLTDRIKYIMKRFLRGQEKGRLKNIDNLMLPIDDYCFIQEFYINVDYEYVFIDNIIDLEFFEMIEKIYNKIKIEILFSDYYGEGFCI